MAAESLQKRSTACKVRIKDIVKSEIVKNDNEPSFILINGEKIYRLNVLGTIVEKSAGREMQFANLVIDDGTDRVSVRSFENPAGLFGFNIGEMLLVIGKPRQFGNEIYLLPEIVKKVDDVNWLKVREHELGNGKIPIENGAVNFIKDDSANETLKPAEKILKLIAEMDKGEGADIDLIAEKSSVDNAEHIIQEMVKDGIVYEVMPGRVKVL